MSTQQPEPEHVITFSGPEWARIVAMAGDEDPERWVIARLWELAERAAETTDQTAG